MYFQDLAQEQSFAKGEACLEKKGTYRNIPRRLLGGYR